MGSVAAVTNCGNMMWRLWIIVMVLSSECLVSSQQYYEPVWSGKRCREDESVDVGRGAGSCNSDCDCPLCAPFCSTSGYCQNHQRAGRRRCSSASASASTGSASACPPLLGDPAPPGCNKTFVEDSYGDIPCQDEDDCPQSKKWWCNEWKPLDCAFGLPTDATIGRCWTDRCTFEADEGFWTWCMDTDTTTLRIVEQRTYEIKEYPCRDDNDCRYTKYIQHGNFKCEYGRCIARNADQYWRLTKFRDTNYFESKLCDRADNCPRAVRFCGEHDGSYTISIGRSPSHTSPLSAQSRRRRSCRNCSKTNCPASRPCRRGRKCVPPTCNTRGMCWCKK